MVSPDWPERERHWASSVGLRRDSQEESDFDAIALALLGRSHPVGVVLAGLLFGALDAGGRTMQAQSGVGIDLITIVQALVIVFIAAPDLVRAVYRVRAGGQAEQVTRGWSV